MTAAGRFIWYELLTSDLDAAIAYYGDVIGWNVVKSRTPGMDYRMINAGEVSVGGMMTSPGSDMPSAWVGYVNVDDVDQTLTAIEATGGKVAWPANTLPGVGRIAMIADPQGAMIYVMAPSGEGESTAFSETMPGHCGWNEYHARDWQAAFDFY
ncbi:MAG: VOC family protein, partial [Asticcacaulis sp.]